MLIDILVSFSMVSSITPFVFTTSSSSIQAGVKLSLNIEGGSGTYTYYYMKLYKNNVLIAEGEQDEMLLIGHNNGSYYIEYVVRDSVGNEKSGTSGTMTISM